MPVTPVQHMAAWRQVLSLSKLSPGERVVVLTSENSDPALIAAASHAAEDLGATVIRLHIPPVFDTAQLGTDPTAVTGESPIDGNPVAIEAMKAADLVIDLVFLLFTPGQKEVLASGTRMLLAYENAETLVRLVPTEDDRRRVLAGKAAFAAGRTMRVTSAAGTHLKAAIGANPITAEYGYVDEPGRWDHWPSGFVARVPDAESAEGTVVLAPGDIILPFKSYVQQPITLTIEKGLITRIEGGFEADFMRQYIEDFAEPDAFAVSHLGWGLQPRARWTSMGLYDKDPTIGMEARAFAGNFLFSTGPGNGRKTRCHLDIPMRGCSFYVDDTPMVLDGRVIPADQIAN